MSDWKSRRSASVHITQAKLCCTCVFCLEEIRETYEGATIGKDLNTGRPDYLVVASQILRQNGD